eukprot:TRINITY_DN11502_c0_g1_i1.p1 TRINITY_DN11502_c0_g1~~TRINITY_DN11502_c0_g1_i1.p1  ORF type:complete len:478 (+),score=80.63 TRINITY_DN11502_c0_g1_i1:30-1436(+)
MDSSASGLRLEVGLTAGYPGVFVPEAAINSEFDAQASTPAKQARGSRSPLGEVTNCTGTDEAEFRLGKPPVGPGSQQVGLCSPSDQQHSDSMSPTAASPPAPPLRMSYGSSSARVSCGSSARMSYGSSSARISYGSSSARSCCALSPELQSPSLDSISPGPNYEMQEKIGEGGFGTVHKVRDIRTDQIHAMKLSKKRSTALREIKLMQDVSNPHVISCLEVVNGRNVVMDLMDCDLKKVIDDQSIKLVEVDIRGIAVQIMTGIAAVHQQGYIHRDVSTRNVLVNSSTGVVKLSDFGIARTVGCSRKLTPVCTTLAYRAPEGLHGGRSYTQALDVWSAGCVIAELFERKEIFPGRSAFDMLDRVLRRLGKPIAKTFERLWRARAKKTPWIEVCDTPWMAQCIEGQSLSAISALVPSASPVGHRLLKGLLQLDPRQRPLAGSVLNDEFFEPVRLDVFDTSTLSFVRGMGC